MGLRFRRTMRLGGGLRVNLSNGGASLSAGPRGFTTNVGRHGVRATVGLPGSGLSYTARVGGHARRHARHFGGAWLTLLVMAALARWLLG